MSESPRRGAVVALLVALVMLVGLAAPASAEPSPPSYVAVIDAGSSGTRLTLYGDDAQSIVPTVVMRVRQSTKGLSSFASSPGQAGPSAVVPLLDELDSFLKEQGIAKAEVPVALLATAGLRNVRRDDKAAAQATIDSAAASISSLGFPIADSRILPAVQEATLAWLDANVLAGTLNSEKGSFGIVEIGGASAQVAFRSPEKKGRGVYIIRVAKQQIPVVAVSYLGLGSNDARSLMQGANDAGAFCFPNNSPGQAPTTYVSTSPRPVAADKAQFQWNRCAAAFRAIITEVGSKRTAAAQVTPSALRDLAGFNDARFVGLGSIPFEFSDLGIQGAVNKRTALRGATEATCSGKDAWRNVLALFAGRPSAFADTLCSSGAYQYEFLFGTAGVGIKHRSFTADSSAFPRDPSWTSGYAVTVLDP